MNHELQALGLRNADLEETPGPIWTDQHDEVVNTLMGWR